MSQLHRLNANWMLTDGVIGPISLERPMTVYEALRSAKLVPDARFGTDLTASEWMYSRDFTYSLDFDLTLPPDRERAELRFERMFGRCSVSLNGMALAPFAPGRFDITPAARSSGNHLIVTVAAEPVIRPFEGSPLPARGISGSVSVTGSNRVTVISADFSAREGELICDLDIDAHISGKYQFTCLLSRNGEAAGEHAIHQRLIAARQRSQLRFPMPEGADGIYEVRLTIEHNGLLCDMLRDAVRIAPPSPAKRVAHVRADSKAQTDAAILALLPALKEAGFDGVSFSGEDLISRPVQTKLFELNLHSAAYDDRASAFPGCPSGAEMRRYAGAESIWPPESAVWRLRSPILPDRNALEAQLGALPRDGGRCPELIRFKQAIDVFDSILQARLAGAPMSIALDADDFPRFFSCALTDPEGAPRPALFAAKAAMAPLLAVTRLPRTNGCCLGFAPSEELMRLPVTLIADGTSPLPVTVTSTLYDAEGNTLSGVSFPALPEGVKQLGELVCQLPPDVDAALLRTVCERPSESPVVHDALLIRSGAAALGGMPAASLSLENGIARNGSRLAVGVVTRAGVRHLLPGETASDCTGEFLNT